MCPAETDDIPQIELDRTANIARNNLRLESLGILQLSKGVAPSKPVTRPKALRVKGLAPIRASSRVASKKHDSLSEGKLSEKLTTHLPYFKLARVSRERMPARTALPDVEWAPDQTFENIPDEEKGCSWFRAFESEPEFDGRTDVAKTIAHRFGSQGISFQTVVGTTSSQMLLAIAFANKGPPSAGIGFAVERVLQGVKAGSTNRP